MKLWYKLISPIIIVSAVVVIVVSFFIASALKNLFFKEDFEKMEELVFENAGHYLQKEYFIDYTNPEAQEQFSEFLEEIRDEDIARTTIWSKNQVILFSDLAPVIGFYSPDHRDLKRLFETGEAFFIEKSEDTNKPVQTIVGGFLDTYIPIFLDGEIQGAVELHMVKAVITEPIEDAIRNIIYILISSGIVMTTLILLIERQIIIKPIHSLDKAAEAISREDFDYPINKKSDDEIGDLVSHFQNMRVRLKSLVGNLEGEVQVRTRSLKEEQAKLMASLNALPRGLMLIDTSGNLLLTNLSLGRILDLSGNPADWTISDIEKKFSGVFDIKGQCARCQKEKTPITIKELFWAGKFLDLFIAPIIMIKDSNEVIGNLVLIGDITEQKILERSKDEFFSIASHELRTPLTAIRGNASMIMDFYKDKIADKDVQEMISDMFAASERLIRIVGDFLDVSRLEQRRMEFKKDNFDIAEITGKTIKEINGNALAKKIELRFDLPDKPLLVMADKDRVKQVLVNLISNSINYTKEGRIVVSFEKIDKFVKVYIKDTGVGIPPTSQSLLFHKFQQAGDVLARDVTQGTGLGLYISKLLVEGMGGSIKLEESTVGKGSVFSFTLPVQE